VCSRNTQYFPGSWLTGTEDVIILSNFILFSYCRLSADPVRFIASKSGSPDLPPWLRFEQKDPTDRAFIYGTPGREVSSQIVLEVRKVILISFFLCAMSRSFLFIKFVQYKLYYSVSYDF